MSAIPPEAIDQVRDRADIVEVVSGYISLRKAGANYRALCPFHEEKTPSFNVNPEKGIFHCFGCGAGGDSIGFVMKYESLNFPEAVRSLAKSYGVEIKETEGHKREAGLVENIRKAMETAAEFYHQSLLKSGGSSPQTKYLAGRGVDDDAVKTFRLGWAPEKWDALTAYLQGKGFDRKILEAAGLSKPSSTGGLIDRFRGRIIFPIHDLQGRTIAFGGRKMEESQPGPKYLNSPETPVYSKSKVLYGLNLASPAARRQDSLVIVEGYMDVIALRMAGIENCAAVSGAALTASQAQAVKRLCGQVIAFFDSDTAGVAAAKKSLPLLLDNGLKAKVLSLSGSKDADEFIQKHGGQKLAGLLEEAPSFAQFVIDVAAASGDESVEGKAAAAREALPYINRIKDNIEREQYLMILSEKTGIDANLLAKEASRAGREEAGRQPAPPARDTRPAKKQGARAAAERIMVRILLDSPEYLQQVAADLLPEDFQDEENLALFQLVLAAQKAGALTREGIMEAARQKELIEAVAERSMETGIYDAEDSVKAARDCLGLLKYRPDDRKRSLDALKSQARHLEGADKEKFEKAKKDYIKYREKGLK